MAVAEFRFYEELNDFLDPVQRKGPFRYGCARRATVKNAIEALGVPHTEVELILVNGESVEFSYVVQDGDRISIYPQFEAFDVTPLLRVRDRPLRDTRFIADSHLGALAKYLRIVGFDTLYRNDYHDREVAAIAATERRIVLSRDKGLLMHRAVTHGCYVRATRPLEQLEEILTRLDLYAAIAPFTRCLLCNAPLRALGRDEAAGRVPEDTVRYYADFRACGQCDRIYWAGSHFRHLSAMLETALARRGNH
ncbi:MAG: Mut7-C RNAse domain-containing protein [Chromatiales bacterium]